MSRVGNDVVRQMRPSDLIESKLETLTYREREIIKLRYGIGDGYTYTLEEAGRIFKVTRERIRQVEAKAIKKLIGMRQRRPITSILIEEGVGTMSDAISRRDEFAKAAMRGLLNGDWDDADSPRNREILATLAIKMADTMIAELDKEKPQ